MPEKPTVTCIQTICFKCFKNPAECGHKAVLTVCFYNCPSCNRTGGRFDALGNWQACFTCQGDQEIMAFIPSKASPKAIYRETNSI
jgi:hypothetical protein